MDKAGQDRQPAHGSEILCPACGQDSLVKRTPLYEGFKRVGEQLACAGCGLVFPGEAAVPYKTRKTLPGFGLEDVPPPPKVFGKQELAETVGRLCRHCDHYVVNPFLQRCALTHREVEATDTCPRFAPKPPPKAGA